MYCVRFLSHRESLSYYYMYSKLCNNEELKVLSYNLGHMYCRNSHGPWVENALCVHFGRTAVCLMYMECGVSRR